jgi:Uma2 family endonuclease
MNANALVTVDKQTFYRLVVRAPENERYEYVRGRIMQQMAGGTLSHAIIARRFASILERQLDTEKWIVAGSDRAIETPESIRYPDVVVEPVGAPGDSLATTQATIVVEVLSASSQERDLDTKPREYMSLPSLQAYIVASQELPLCLVWSRQMDGKFPALPIQVRGPTETIDLAPLAVTISLAEVYRAIA